MKPRTGDNKRKLYGIIMKCHSFSYNRCGYACEEGTYAIEYTSISVSGSGNDGRHTCYVSSHSTIQRHGVLLPRCGHRSWRWFVARDKMWERWHIYYLQMTISPMAHTHARTHARTHTANLRYVVIFVFCSGDIFIRRLLCGWPMCV